MEFCYRGVRYNRPAQTLETTESEILARYRGNAYRVRYSERVEISQPSPLCKYRGVPYRTLADGSIGTVSPEERRSLVPLAAKVALTEAQRIHTRHLCYRLNERITTARASGDERLVAMLEREGRELLGSR
ncbi:MAG: DUF4278 domain-containing protein [Geitlerinemataceae cyanobacterium]